VFTTFDLDVIVLWCQCNTLDYVCGPVCPSVRHKSELYQNS